MITISWYPGKLKGYSQAETQQIIIEACQQWQSVSGVRFGTLAAGQPTRITIYPYYQDAPWAMATYQATGQILYNGTRKYERDWAVMAFAHEIGHCFGWGHAPSREESLMFTRGSSVRYFDHIDAQRARQQFGRSNGYHWPYSLRYVGDKIRAEKKVLAKAKSEFEKWDTTWDKKNGEWNYWKQERAKATNRARRDYCNKNVASTLKSRDTAGVKRKTANAKVSASHKRLKPLSNQWLRIKRQWDSIGGIKLPAAMAMQDDGPCACFVDDDKVMRASDDLLEAFKDLPKDTVPVLGL